MFECLFDLCDNWKTLLLINVCCYSDFDLLYFNSHNAAYLEAIVLIEFSILCVIRGVATNSGLGGGASSNRDLFCIVSTKSLMFLHHVNNIEHNLKRNIHTGIEVISLIPP